MFNQSLGAVWPHHDELFQLALISLIQIKLLFLFSTLAMLHVGFACLGLRTPSLATFFPTLLTPLPTL